MKKILAILLAAMFVMSMSIMAFAAELEGTASGYKAEYNVDEEVKLDGLVIAYKDSEGQDQTAKYGETKGTFDFTPKTAKADTTEIKVTFTSEDGSVVVKTSFKVTVKTPDPGELSKIVINKYPTKLTYNYGEDFDPEGLVITFTDSKGSKQVTYNSTTKGDFDFLDYNKNKTGEQTVTVTYGGAKATFKVTVKPKDGGPELTIDEYPTKKVYTVGDSVNAAGLVVTFKDGDTKEPVSYIGNESKFAIDPTELTKAGDQEIQVTYKGATAAFKVTVKEKKTASLKVHNAKSVYAVGEAFDYSSLAVAYIPAEGDNVQIVWYKDGNIGVSGFNSKVVADKVTITVTYRGLQATYDIAVKNLKTENETIVKDLWAAKNDLDNNPNATIGDYVEKYTSIISSYIAADNMDDIDRYIATADKGQELVQDSSLYPDNWNEFVKVYTDYLPTGVNQALDIAARLGWDASDQDFVQDIIDLVKGAAESDKAADNGTTANNGGSTTTTDANPKTGSTSAIAVFAVLSVAAAAAVVCTKKKED